MQADTERDDSGEGAGPGGDRRSSPHPSDRERRPLAAPPPWAGSQPPGGQAPREKPGSRPSPAGQLAARGPGLNSPDENANLQLAGSVKQIRGNKTGRNAGKSPANPSLGCFQNKREGGARLGGEGGAPAREGSVPLGPARPAPPLPLVTRVRVPLGGGGRPGRVPAGPSRVQRAEGAGRVPGDAAEDEPGPGAGQRRPRRRPPRPTRLTGDPRARRRVGARPPVTMTAAAVTWAQGTVATERSPGARLGPALDCPLPALVLRAQRVGPRARPPPSLPAGHAPPGPQRQLA